ncbi:MAG: hypothetical protein KKF77_09415 [Proteobacteria bacterium]|nr:hypothetical protein [Pseudomonadota bacterium]
MIHETLIDVAAVLRDLREHVGTEEADVLRQACIVLEAAAEDVVNLETLLPIAGTGEAAQHVAAQA